MSQRSVYDTPPDGDFARYVEALGRESAARLLQQEAVTASPGRQHRPPRTARPASASAAPVPAPASAARASPFASVRKLLSVAFVLWCAYTVAAALFPPLSVLGVPLLIFFAVAVFARLKSLPWADWAQQLRREAEQKIQRPSRPQ